MDWTWYSVVMLIHTTRCGEAVTATEKKLVWSFYVHSRSIGTHLMVGEPTIPTMDSLMLRLLLVGSLTIRSVPIDFKCTTNLGILNVDCKPTFRNSVRTEVLDISLASGRVETRIRSWRISEEVSLSDHHLITFQLKDVKPDSRLCRNPRNILGWV